PSKAIIPITKKDRFGIHILPLTLIFAEFLKKQISCYFIALLSLVILKSTFDNTQPKVKGSHFFRIFCYFPLILG
ncbi:hypothetical protein ACIQTF_000440, partial [Enterococcus faecium]|nr:hypothetical protein [Enterococcus faecium]